MKLNTSKKILLCTLLLSVPQIFIGTSIKFNPLDENGALRTHDEEGRPLPTSVDVIIFKNEERFINYINAIADAGKVLATYGPTFSKVVTFIGTEVAGKAAEAGVGAATENPGAGKVAGKVTHKITKKALDKYVPALNKFLTGAATKFFAGKIQAAFIFKELQNKNTEKFPNPICKSVMKGHKLNKETGLSEDKPRQLYIAIFSSHHVTDGQGNTIIKKHELLWNNHLTPEKDPNTGEYYAGEGNAKGGPFASWEAKAAYITNEVVDDNGNPTGETYTKPGVIMTELDPRGGVTCN